MSLLVIDFAAMAVPPPARSAATVATATVRDGRRRRRGRLEFF
jgi:hypothetical protein